MRSGSFAVLRNLSCAFALVLAVASPARAQQSEGARARAAYLEGQAEYNLGHFAKALEKYESAYKIKAVPALLFNIAQCHRQLGAMRDAATTYKAYLRTAAEKDPNRVKAEALLAEVESAISSQAQAQGARPLEPAPDEGAKPSDGPPQLDATAVPGGAPQAEGTAVATAPAPSGVVTNTVPDAATTAPAPPPKSPRRTFTWVALGGTGVALAGGVVFGLKSKSANSDLTSSHHTSAQVDSLTHDVSSNAGKANAFFVAGAVLAAVTATFFVLKF